MMNFNIVNRNSRNNQNLLIRTEEAKKNHEYSSNAILLLKREGFLMNRTGSLKNKSIQMVSGR